MECPQCDSDDLLVFIRDPENEQRCRIECQDCGDVIRYSVTRREVLEADTEAEYQALLLRHNGQGWRIDPQKVVERHTQSQ